MTEQTFTSLDRLHIALVRAVNGGAVSDMSDRDVLMMYAPARPLAEALQQIIRDEVERKVRP